MVLDVVASVTRCMALYKELGITRDVWCEKTGFSEDQYYRWHNKSAPGSPRVSQAARVFESLDISPTYVWFGLGAKRLSEVVRRQQPQEQQMDFWRNGGASRLVEFMDRLERLEDWLISTVPSYNSKE